MELLYVHTPMGQVTFELPLSSCFRTLLPVSGWQKVYTVLSFSLQCSLGGAEPLFLGCYFLHRAEPCNTNDNFSVVLQHMLAESNTGRSLAHPHHSHPKGARALCFRSEVKGAGPQRSSKQYSAALLVNLSFPKMSATKMYFGRNIFPQSDNVYTPGTM